MPVALRLSAFRPVSLSRDITDTSLLCFSLLLSFRVLLSASLLCFEHFMAIVKGKEYLVEGAE
jgi:hypothetical protein